MFSEVASPESKFPRLGYASIMIPRQLPLQSKSIQSDIGNLKPAEPAPGGIKVPFKVISYHDHMIRPIINFVCGIIFAFSFHFILLMKQPHYSLYAEKARFGPKAASKPVGNDTRKLAR